MATYDEMMEAITGWVETGGGGMFDIRSQKVDDIPVSGEIKAAIRTWDEICLKEQGKSNFPCTAFSLLVDLGHSALIHWILDGNEPLDRPPPCRYSRPDHRLIVEGQAHIDEVIDMRQWDWPIGDLCLDKSSDWTIIEEHSPNHYVISFYGEDRWELKGDNENGWDLRLLNKVS